MKEDAGTTDLLGLTALIVTNHVANNSVHAGDLPKMITTIHAALAGLEAPDAQPTETVHQPAVSARKSLASDEHIISMIDGKPYRTLRRHLRTHGLTDKDYRARYGLPADYPMVAKAYSAARATIAKTLGLGRKAGGKVADGAAAVEAKVEDTAAPVVAKVRRGASKAAAKVEGAVKPAKRGRKSAAK